MMNKLTSKTRQKLGRPMNFYQATEQDVKFCPPLLLNREQDETGWHYWSDLVNNHHISLQALCDGFTNIELHLNIVAEETQTLIFSGGEADSNGRIINESEPLTQDQELPSVEGITLLLLAQADSGLEHLDIIAYPRSV